MEGRTGSPAGARSRHSSTFISLPFLLNGLLFFSYPVPAPPPTALKLLMLKLATLPQLGHLLIFTSGTNSLPSAPFFNIETSRLAFAFMLLVVLVVVVVMDEEEGRTARGGSEPVDSALVDKRGRLVPDAENDARPTLRANVIGYLLYSSSASLLDLCAGKLATLAERTGAGIDCASLIVEYTPCARCGLATLDLYAFIAGSRSSPVPTLILCPSFGGAEKLYTLALHAFEPSVQPGMTFLSVFSGARRSHAERLAFGGQRTSRIRRAFMMVPDW